MVPWSRRPFELPVCFFKKGKKGMVSLFVMVRSAVDTAGKHGYDNNDLWIYKDCLLLQSSSKHFLSHRSEIRFEICLASCRNGLPLIWGDMTGFGLKDQAVEGELIHLFLVPIMHVCSERPDGCLFCKQVYCLKMSPLFLKNLLL